MNSNAIIIYVSFYNNNTLKLAKTMAQTLGCSYITADKALNMNLDAYETIGLGSGIYFGQHHPKLFEIASKLSEIPQNVFLFSSRGNPFLGKYHQPLKDALNRKTKNIIGDFSVRGYDGTGPWVIIGGGNKGKPNEKDLKKAIRFIHNKLPQHCMPDYYLQLKSKLPISEGRSNVYHININSKSILLSGDRVTFNHYNCNGCGKCVSICPLGIIQLENSKPISKNELDCTLCRLCLVNCKQRAIELHFNWRDAISVAKRHEKRKSHRAS